MSNHQRGRTWSPRGASALGGAFLLVLGLGLSGCGEDSKPTRSEVREKRVNDPVRRDSVSARIGDIRLQTVRIERPQGAFAAGSNSAMFMTLSNSGADDRLLAVATVDARSVVQREGAEAPAPTIDIAVPGGDVVSMQSPYGLHLELLDLKSDLGQKSFLPVTFRFARAGKVTVQVFVSGVDRQVVPPIPSTSAGVGLVVYRVTTLLTPMLFGVLSIAWWRRSGGAA